MPTIEFKFSPNQRVRTSLGDEGLIDTCAIMSGPQHRYYVILKGGTGAWLDEDQLTVAD